MAKFIGESEHVPLPKAAEDFGRQLVDRLYSSTGGESAYRIRATLQNEMNDRVFVERNERGMRHALDTIDGLQEAYKRVQLQDKGKCFNTELVDLDSPRKRPGRKVAEQRSTARENRGERPLGRAEIADMSNSLLAS